MIKLLMDTSTQALILALSEDDRVIASLFDVSSRNHSERLVPKIHELLTSVGRTIQEVDAFIVGSGPGSYTGVRIGVTVAKMFAYTLEKPLYEVSSLALIASSYLGKADYIIPVMDARRESVFTTIYDARDGQLDQLVEERLYPLTELNSIVETKELSNVLVVGLDSKKYQEFFTNHHIPFTDDLEESIDFKRLFTHSRIEEVTDVHAFVPHYRRITEAEYNIKGQS